MPVYKKRRNSDTWHWCSNCSNYPLGSDVDIRSTKPISGELCYECLSKDKKGTWYEPLAKLSREIGKATWIILGIASGIAALIYLYHYFIQ